MKIYEKLTDVELLGLLKPVGGYCVVEGDLLAELIKRYQQASKAFVEAILIGKKTELPVVSPYGGRRMISDDSNK